MDKFKYIAAIKQIETNKLVSTAELYVRNYREICLEHSLKYRSTFASDSPKFKFEEIKHMYKCYRYALNRFGELSTRILPSFLYDDCNRIQINLLYITCELEYTHMTNARDYSVFIDLFKFDTELIMPSGTSYIEALNSIISDNPVHFKSIQWNHHLTYFDQYSTEQDANPQKLAYAIRHKQVNFPDKPQTIWDWFTADLVKMVSTIESTNVDADITKLQQQINALTELKETYAK